MTDPTPPTPPPLIPDDITDLFVCGTATRKHAQFATVPIHNAPDTTWTDPLPCTVRAQQVSLWWELSEDDGAGWVLGIASVNGDVLAVEPGASFKYRKGPNAAPWAIGESGHLDWSADNIDQAPQWLRYLVDHNRPADHPAPTETP